MNDERNIPALSHEWTELTFFITSGRTEYKSACLAVPLLVCCSVFSCCRGNILTEPCLFVAAGTCLASRWLEMDFRSGCTIPAFRRHVTYFLNYWQHLFMSIQQNKVAQAVTFVTCILEVTLTRFILGRYWVRISARSPNTLTEDLHSFPQCLHKSVVNLGNSRFFSHLFWRVAHQPIIRHYIISVTDTIVK
jgi:hypothetical protein